MKPESKLFDIYLKLDTIAEEIMWYMYVENLPSPDKEFLFSQIEEIQKVLEEIHSYKKSMLKKVKRVHETQDLLTSEFDW